MEKSHSVQVELIYSFFGKIYANNRVDKFNNLQREWLKVSIKRKPLSKKVMREAGNWYYLSLFRQMYYPINNLKIDFRTENTFDTAYTDTPDK